MTDDPHFWLGYLSSAIRTALKRDPENARSMLRDSLATFRASEACTPELDRALGAKQRPRKAEPAPEAAARPGPDLNVEWKACGNPECGAPIPKQSRKTHCDEMCRNVARDHAEAELRAKHPNYDSIPF